MVSTSVYSRRYFNYRGKLIRRNIVDFILLFDTQRERKQKFMLLKR